MVTLSSTPYVIYRPYLFTSPITNYNFFLVLRGIDIVTTQSNIYYIFTAIISDHDGINCKISFTGYLALLK